MWMYSTTAARQSHQNVVSCQRTTAVIYGGWRRHSPSLQSFLKGETKKEKFKQTKIFIKRINRNNVGVEWIPIEPFKERPPSTPPYMRTGTANICSLTPCDFLSHWSIFQLTRHHKGWFQRKRREKRGEKKRVTKTQQMLNSWWDSLLRSLAGIMMPYTPEYNIKWVFNVDIRYSAVIRREPFHWDKENCDFVFAWCP